MKDLWFKVFIFLFIFTGVFAQPPYKTGSPSRVVNQLYSIYKNYDFRKALTFTTGKEKQKVEKILGIMNRNNGKAPQEIITFSKTLQELKIVGEQINNQYARVDTLWILKHHDKKNPQEFLIKVQEIAFLLEKEQDLWKIRSSRFITEHILYDRNKIDEIYKKAQKYDS